jgi:hypothetical protein
MNGDSVSADRWYRVDAGGTIVDVDPDWDRFALANGGERATRHCVLGRPLSDFLTGDITRMYLDAALDAARMTGQPRVLAYRCDSPWQRRWLEMTLQPLPGGDVQVGHRLMRTEPRNSATRVRYVPPARTSWYRCSQCLRLLAGAKPTPDDDTASHDQLAVADTVCDRCLATERRALAASG